MNAATTFEPPQAASAKTSPARQTHVLHVVPGLMAGGMELAMAQVISGLNGDGLRHSIICLKGDAEIAHRLPASVDIHCMHSWPHELKLPLRISRLIRQIRPSVVHARNWGAWTDTVVASRLLLPRVPAILSFHGLGKAGYMPWRRRMASYFLARLASGLFTVSGGSKEFMVEKWGWPERKASVIPNGVDTQRFVPAVGKKTSGRIVVGTVGNLRPVKNHPLLLEACGELVRRGCDLQIQIAGEGEERAKLLALADSLNLSDRLTLCGRVEDTPSFLQGLDIFVLSSDSEQHPNALNEAMACGLPCVATRVGCVAELLDDGQCGQIVEPGDRAQLAEALSALLASSQLRQTHGFAARARACESYSLSNMLSAYRKLYNQFSVASAHAS